MNCFPPIKPYKTHRLNVDAEHQLYIEECGNRQGIPILFLHGGPGGGCTASHRQYFDPNRYRIILFDQRGCGRSTPHASLNNNTTWDLVDDIEKIRELLQIDQWVVYGGSWGSTLALSYAEKHPQPVLRIILRGIFLCRDEDIKWFYQQGSSRLFPEAWADYLKPIPESERHNMIEAYYKRLTSNDEIVRMSAAKAWSIWEGRTATLLPNKAFEKAFSDPYFALSFARIECHYFINQCFLSDNQLLNEVDKIAEIGGYIVHGRYDAICPVDQATKLHSAWPNSQLSIIDDAGHALSESGISTRIVEITEQIADELS